MDAIAGSGCVVTVVTTWDVTGMTFVVEITSFRLSAYSQSVSSVNLSTAVEDNNINFGESS